MDPFDAAPPLPDETDRDRLFRMSLDLLCVAGLDGYFRQVNPAWTRVLGWSREELLSRPVIDFVHPEDRERTLESRRQLAQTGRLSGFENRYQCKDGTYRWLSWQTSVAPGQPTVFGVARDVTERRRLDHDRFMAGKQESAALLAAGMAHDFNNLLASMLLNLEMVSLSGPVEERQRLHLQQALESIHAARGLTEQLVTIAKGGPSPGRLTDLGGAIREAAARVLGGSNVEVEYRLAEDLRPVNADAVQMAQVFGNLLANAREAMPAGGTVSIRAANRSFDTPPAPSYPEGNYVEVTIADRGPGIPPEARAKVFDPYFSTKPRADRKGTGLGLTIARAVLRRYGGLVELECPPGGGTVARCLLPAAREEGEIGGSGV